MNATFPVQATLKIKNGHLASAVEKMGSQSALAQHLGLWPSLVGQWCNMQSCPPAKPNRWWPIEKLEDIESKLLSLTGETLDEIFPQELRDRCELTNAPVTFTRRIDVEKTALLEFGQRTCERLIAPDPANVIESAELYDKIAEAVKTLPEREQQILKDRFGLDSYPVLTLVECAHKHRVTQERIRQIEMRAVRHLQMPSITSKLIDYVA